MLPLRIKEYVKLVKASLVELDDDIEKVSIILSKVKKEKGRVWILGNGGSLAIAQHFSQDLLKMCSVRAHTINCPSLITAYSNDDTFDFSYFNPVIKLIDAGDPIIIFSCSGKSRNYVEFVSGFPEMKNPIISIVGTDGGFLKQKSTICVHVKSLDYQVCETAFCMISDLLVKSLEE